MMLTEVELVGIVVVVLASIVAYFAWVGYTKIFKKDSSKNDE